MWADVDTRQDFLNFSEVADLVVDVVGSPAMRPVSVGVFGTWGTGKSTLLNLIEDGLSANAREGRFIVVRFDAWLYQGYDDARAALMEVIATRLLKEAKGNEGLIENLIGAMPRERVFTEADGPFAAADSKPLAPGDVGRAREALSDCWSVVPDEVGAFVLAAFRRLAASPVGGPAASA